MPGQNYDESRSSSSATATSASPRAGWARSSTRCEAARRTWRSRPSPRASAGGSVSRWASRAGRSAGGVALQMRAPISGQRALRASVLEDVLPFAPGFGMEIGMTIDAARAGHRIAEVELDLSHRATGRTLSGFAPSRPPARRFRAGVRRPAVGSRRDDPRDRPGHDRHHLLRVRRARRADRTGLPRVHPALSPARLGRARRGGDLVGHAGRRGRGAGRCRGAGRRAGRGRDRQPARDGLRLGPGHGRAAAQRDRLAGPSHRRAL